MRIIVHGQQAFGKSVLESMLKRGDDVVAVYCAPDKGSRTDPLKEFALEKGFEVLQPVSWKDPAVHEQLKTHNADLCVMAYVTLFVPEDALNIPKLGSIQYHPSLLPMHKGPSSINWPIIMGAKKTGLSIFWPDKGLDTGPILLQREVDISPNDTLGSLYFNHLYPMGVDAMLEAIDMVKDGTAPKLVQDADAGSYEGWCDRAVGEVDWNKPAQEVYNLIRGCNPQPGAWSTINGKTVQFYDSQLASGENAGKPGELLSLDGDSMTIAAKGGAVVVSKVRPDGGGKTSSGEFVDNAGLSVGARFG